MRLEDNLNKISMLVGKPVVSIFEGKMIGYVKNAFFDDKFTKIDWLELFDKESENEYVIATKNVYSLDDIVVIKNTDCILQKETIELNKKSPVNYPVFSTNGKNCGKICDIVFDEKFKTVCFEIDKDTTYKPNQFLNIGQNVAIIQPQKQTKLSNFKSKPKIATKNISANNIVTIQNNTQNKISSPKKILTDSYDFLIGRKLDKNIYADNKQLLAKRNSIITSNIIDNASKNGKLKELTNSSISN